MRSAGVARSLLCCLCFLFLALTLSSCRRPPEKTAATRERVTVAYPLTVYSVLFQVALGKGYFEEEGLDVTARPFEVGRMALKSMLEGEADIAISGDTTFMFAVTGGARINTIAVIATSKKNEAIVARKDRGIRGPKDLTGKRVGIFFGTTAHFFLDSFLTAHGIDRNSVILVDMKPGRMREALEAGEVDAVAVWNPFIRQLERQLGERGMVFYDETIYSDIVCVSAGQEYTGKHPGAIKKMLRALIKAETFIRERPDESRHLVAGLMKTDKGVLDDIWGVMRFRVTLDQSLLVNLEDETRWAQTSGLVPGKETLNYLDFINVEGLLSVKPEAVRIIR